MKRSKDNHLPGQDTAHSRRTEVRLTSKQAEVARTKATILELFEKGHTAEDSCRLAGKSVNIWKYYRKTDKDFRDRADLIVAQRNSSRKVDGTTISFEEFSAKYLHMRLFRHQLQWVDLIEGREPRDLHPSQTYKPGDPDTIIINTPPGHCAEVSTPVLTRDGWKTIGTLTTDDWLILPDGTPCPVDDDLPNPHETDLFEVEFGDGEVITTDADHVWHVQRSRAHKLREMTTAQIMGDLRSPSGQLKWRVPAHRAVELEKQNLPLDPYVFGYWLGDGETGGSRFAVSEEDRPFLEAHLEAAGFPVTSRDDRVTYSILYPSGLRQVLRSMGMMDEKYIPVEYETGSVEQRLALLQGLLDSDGTISIKDGRVKFAQDARRESLNRQVYRLIASLGFQPRMRTYDGLTEICFKPDTEPVFRLARKSCRQYATLAHRRTDFRTIKNVRPAGRGMVRCVSVVDDMREFLIGESLIRTRNAKSTTITMNYVTYKIVTNPNFRVVIISKTETMAKKFLQGIKRRLTQPAFRELIADFAPPDGFEKSAEVWTSTMIYFGHGDSDEKDPNVQVLGIGQQIYGARADLIILDDVEDLNNAHQYAAHLDYIMQDVMTRDAPLLVVGTRVAPVDIYSELLNPEHYDGEASDWTHLTQPAILSSSDDGEWETLWPYSDRPHPTRPGTPNEEGLWPKWDRERLGKLRRKIKPATWALVYQQQPVSEDSLFTIEAVNGCQSNRTRGRLRAGEGNLPHDLSSFYVVAGLDPATKAGHTAAICLAVDRNTGKRYLLDCANAQLSPTQLRTLIMDWTERLGIQEWRVERNSFQAFLTQDREITQYLASRGVRLREHQTHKNKWDPQWGVSSLEMLFRGYQDGTALLDLPGLGQNESYRTFKEQLVTWYPDHPKDQKTDMVMAFWFAELAARDATRDLGMTQQYHMDNPFLSENDKFNRVVIDIDQWLRDERAAM